MRKSSPFASGAVRGPGDSLAPATRPLLLLALLSLSFLSASLYAQLAALPVQSAESSQAPPSGSPYDSVWLRDARWVGVGGSDALWVRWGRSPSDTQAHVLQVDLYARPPARRVVLLEGPWVGNDRMPALRAALASALTPLSWRLESQNLSELAPSAEPRLFILPSGAWPSDLLARWDSLLGPQDVVVYFGVLDNQTLSADGSLQRGGVPDRLLAPGEPLEGLQSAQRLPPTSGPSVWRIGRTLNEYEDVPALAQRLADRLACAPIDERIAGSQLRWGAQDHAALVPHASGRAQGAYARLLLRDPQGRIQRLWDLYAPPSEGMLDGPASVSAATPAPFQVRLYPDYPQRERIRYLARIHGPDSTLRQTLELGEGHLQPGGAWVGSFLYANWSEPGDWWVSIEDPFGREYAAALVHVYAYRIEALEPSGGAQRVRILKDGVPLPDGPVRLRVAGREAWTEARIIGGALAFSLPRPMPALIEIEAEGVVLRYDPALAPADPWAAAIAWGLPALMLTALAYLLLVPRSARVYRIHLREGVEPSRPPLRRPPAYWMKLLARAAPAPSPRAAPWVVDAPQAAQILRQCDESGRPLLVGSDAAQELLDELSARGHLARWRDCYGPLAPGEKPSALRRRALAARLRDRLLEQGLSPRPLRTPGALADSKGRHWEIHDPDHPIWETRRAPPDRIVFADEEERAAFRAQLASAPGPRASVLRLALASGRLKLINLTPPIE